MNYSGQIACVDPEGGGDGGGGGGVGRWSGPHPPPEK